MIKRIRFYKTIFELERERIVIQTIIESEKEVIQRMIRLKLNEKSKTSDESEKNLKNRGRKL